MLFLKARRLKVGTYFWWPRWEQLCLTIPQTGDNSFISMETTLIHTIPIHMTCDGDAICTMVISKS